MHKGRGWFILVKWYFLYFKSHSLQAQCQDLFSDPGPNSSSYIPSVGNSCRFYPYNGPILILSQPLLPLSPSFQCYWTTFGLLPSLISLCLLPVFFPIQFFLEAYFEQYSGVINKTGSGIDRLELVCRLKTLIGVMTYIQGLQINFIGTNPSSHLHVIYDCFPLQGQS